MSQEAKLYQISAAPRKRFFVPAPSLICRRAKCSES